MNGSRLQQTIQAPLRIDATDPIGILIVEDDADAAMVTRMVLELNGFQVRVVESSAEALVEMTSFDPIAVVVDLGLGDGQAFALVDQVAKITRGAVPIIGLSGLRQSNVFERCMNLGIADLISKPFSPSELLQRITACVRA